jgi:hypothetical protein
MNRLSRTLIAVVPLVLVNVGFAASPDSPRSSASGRHPGCDGLDAKACVALAIEAMGGREKLEAIQTVHADVIGHAALMEQSYRQAPFITSYERDHLTVDFQHGRTLDEQHGAWPESDLKGADSDITLITTADGGAYRTAQGESPCSGADLESAAQTLSLGPERLLLVASVAEDLHYERSQMLRSTLHTVVAFHWNRIPVRILLGPTIHLPDAIDTVQEFKDFWYYWGDVQQRVYWDNWKLVKGIVYPTNQITERNGSILSSSQVLNIDFNQPVDEKPFAIAPKVAQQSKDSKGWSRPFPNKVGVDLAPGVTFFAGSWNATVVKQDDGVVILETPISGAYTEGLVAAAKAKYPGQTIKAVLSTSDSWPHVGGIRYDASQGFKTYILDLNEPLLNRMIAAPHTLSPDALQDSQRKPNWVIVSGKTEIGSSQNRMVLYPLRGASTERQYMVYFPEHRLLYASDTLVLNGDDSLYDPELMREVKLAVDREHLEVDTVYAMHQGPEKWSKIVTLIQKEM